MPEAHSYWSASGFARDVACPGSKILSEGLADRVGEAAAWGTVGHDYADAHLKAGTSMGDAEMGAVHQQDGHTIVVDLEMVNCVNTYLDKLREMTATADFVESEQRVNYAKWLNVPEDRAWGTLDAAAVFIDSRELLVGDLKTGRGVEVSAVENEQMMLYASGKLLVLDELGIDIDTIRLVIFQPRVGAAPSEWTISRTDLEAWLLGRARSAVATVENARNTVGHTEWDATFLRPGDHCHSKFCKARATCPALRAAVAETAFETVPATPEDFADQTVVAARSDMDWLEAVVDKADMIEDFLKAARAELERRFLAGERGKRFKLVQGKRGNRQWSDAAQAEDALKRMRVKHEQMFEYKLISPTTAEKLAKAEVIGPRQWPALQALITQSEGKPSVAPASDPRPAIEIRPIDDEFTTQADDIC